MEPNRPVLIRLLIVVIAAVTMAGCQPQAQPTLVSARFLDEVKTDGIPQEGETIVLVFSDAVVLENQPAKAGARLSGNGNLGVYELRSSDRQNELQLVIGRGASFQPIGHHGEAATPDASGISLDFDNLSGLKTSTGTRFGGTSRTVDVAVAPHSPPALESCHWVDTDKSFTVSPSDVLRLTFDREVELPPQTKKTGKAPHDLFYLPIDGDVLGDRRPPLLSQVPSGTPVIDVILGDRPHLRLQGEFSSLQPGAASGIAINGTRIRPHGGISGLFADGVMSSRVIDIEGECEPFRTAIAGTAPSSRLYHHTATTLPGGRVLVVGGIAPNADSESAPTDEAWLYDPATGLWSRAGKLTQRRYRHTATYFLGPDREDGTLDDFVLIFGGYDEKPVERAEIYLPNAPVPEFIPVTHDPGPEHTPRPRYWHTAHRVPDTETDLSGPKPVKLVVAGGLGHDDRLEPRIEQLSIRVNIKSHEDVSVEIRSKVVGQLHTARIGHAALLIPEGEELGLFVFGGFGLETANFTTHRLEKSATLRSPEWVVLNEQTPESGQLCDEPQPKDVRPTGRRDHRLLELREENWPYLLVGGTTRSMWPQPRRTNQEDFHFAYRIELDYRSSPPRVNYTPCGLLEDQRQQIAAVVLENGNVLVAGGRDAEDNPTDTVHLFNTETNTFENFCQPMLSPRESFQIVNLLDGEWLIVGGSPPGKPPAEIFRGDPY